MNASVTLLLSLSYSVSINFSHNTFKVKFYVHVDFRAHLKYCC